MIHEQSARANKPFSVINCASLPRDLMESELFGYVRGCFTGATTDRPGRVEYAAGGTILLDEIGDLPLALQPKLLTLLQDGTFQRLGSDRMHEADVRIIGATHRNLIESCSSGEFRLDLYYRLSVVSLEVAPLRLRKREIPKLANELLRRQCQLFKMPMRDFADETMQLLVDHDWPGNVRELENVIERACVFSDAAMIEPQSLQFDRMTLRQSKQSHDRIFR